MSVSAWVFLNSSTFEQDSVTYPILSCSSSIDSVNNSWSFGFSDYYNDITQFGIAFENWDSDGNSICAARGAGAQDQFYQYSIGSWQLITMTMNSVGQVQFYLNGQQVSEQYGAASSCNTKFDLKSRPFCRVGSQAYAPYAKWLDKRNKIICI
jgi:hypothetical protein